MRPSSTRSSPTPSRGRDLGGRGLPKNGIRQRGGTQVLTRWYQTSTSVVANTITATHDALESRALAGSRRRHGITHEFPDRQHIEIKPSLRTAVPQISSTRPRFRFGRLPRTQEVVGQADSSCRVCFRACHVAGGGRCRTWRAPMPC